MAEHTLEDQLILHEGLKLSAYQCPAGYWTIGVGRNLEAKGLTDFEQVYIFGRDGMSKQEVIERLKEQGVTTEQAMWLLANDISECIKDLKTFTWFDQLDDVRTKVVVDMRFNLGAAGFRKFRKMIAALERDDYGTAANEMVDSAWYQQAGTRTRRLVKMMRTGEDYTD
jgi:lysozyme